LSTIMLSMVSIIGMVVIKFSFKYMEGEKKHLNFLSKIVLTITSVQLLVISGNLFMLFLVWISTSLLLNSLILFYKERPLSVISSRKKFILARMGDLSLLSAFIILYNEFSTGQLNVIFTQITSDSWNQDYFGLIVAASLIAITAILKSAQLPFHGWLLGVMEAPTPVSALLHAGLLNAGPFLVLRFSSLIDLSLSASLFLLLFGSLTALFGTLVYVTQPSVKTSLAKVK
jgi:NAD(P)H-quinone oxidoreductase subunit 5